MMYRNLLLSAALFPLAACTTMTGDTQKQEAPAVGMANPASEYCIQQGGQLEIRKTPEGEVGYCHLPDGQVVEEWALFRAAHNGQQ
ncbi:DUF333 domain-containing protein [Lautropia mirabilis]|uniref:putative hemolysin n=1 Tax=Lautropia mirabilis TaxID=47671 RepID=UPI00288BE0CB|nr:DUF333 domain-containing protein [Lautropia mirabilis]